MAISDALSARGFEVIKLPADPSLPEPVNGHADLLVFILDEFLLTRRDYYATAKKEIDRVCEASGMNLLISDNKAGGKYPDDCGFCAAISGNTVICREKSTDSALLTLARGKDYSVLNVNQGYAKCSCAILADGSIITADLGIAKATQGAGIDTLTIEPGRIDLPGYGCGFIGGASGLCGITLYFCGNIEIHPEHQRILEFAERHNTDIVSLSDEVLYDVGSLIFV